MSPVPGAITIAPSTVFHCAGPPLLFSHFDRSLPSKRITASEGGFPGASGVLAVPGVITAGTGRLRSETFQRVRPASRCALWSAGRALVMSMSDAMQGIRNTLRSVNETSLSFLSRSYPINRPSRKLFPWSTGQHGEAAHHYGAAMRGQVADPGGGHAADQHGKAA